MNGTISDLLSPNVANSQADWDDNTGGVDGISVLCTKIKGFTPDFLL